MLLPSVNRYYRALQYQQLKTPQFGMQEPPGFFVEVRAWSRPAICRFEEGRHTWLQMTMVLCKHAARGQACDAGDNSGD